MDIPKEGGWTFENTKVAAAFDDHVREQLPWYDLATGLTAHICRHYIPRDGVVYDIGASTGNIGLAIKEMLDDRNATLYAVEPAREMASLYKGPGTLINTDALDVEFKPFDVAVCFLVLMFIPPKDRPVLIDRLRANLRKGGAIIIFDKREPSGGYVSTIMARLAMAGKLSSGAKPDEIVKKELSLSGVQRPISMAEIDGAVEVFRFGEFSGWIIEA